MTESVVDVAVVIPAYEAEGTIRAAVVSAQEQAPPPSRVIVVNDGSTDRTSIVAGSTGADVMDQANAGPGAARNRGASEADAACLVFLDADDVLLPGFLAACLRALESHPAAAVVPNKLIASPDSVPLWPLSGRSGRIARPELRTLIRQNWLHPTGLILKEQWARHPFEEDRAMIGCEDTLFWMDLLLSGQALIVLNDAYVAEQEDRRSPLTSNVRQMRLARYQLYLRLLRYRPLTPRERMLASIKFWKLSIWRSLDQRKPVSR